MASVPSTGVMDQGIKDCGRMEYSMGMGNLLNKMEQSLQGHGRMESIIKKRSLYKLLERTSKCPNSLDTK